MPDFSELLHVLRERELQRLPEGAGTVVHGGASGSWYVRWFDEHYPGTVARHVCVEGFAPEPADLPGNVEWLARNLGSMDPVPDSSVDMVFGGQVIEHLWPADVAGFLLESHRVLRPDGHLVLDSPNRRVTEAIAWHHPEHTVEFSVEEIVDLVELAGFDVAEIRGVLLGYDAARHRFLGIDPETAPMAWDERAAAAPDRPEDSFIWWLVTTRAAREPDASALRARAAECFEAFRAARLRRLETPRAVIHETGALPRAVAEAGHPGPLLHGPYVPVDAGRWRATFTLRGDGQSVGGPPSIAWLDVASDSGGAVHARRDVNASELAGDGRWTALDLDFTLRAMTMGVELRAHSLGRVPLEAQLAIELQRIDDVPAYVRCTS